MKIAPFIEELSQRYPDVVFLKVGEHNCQDLIMQLGVSAFPTFHFYVNGKKVDEMKGANPRGIEDKVIQHQVVGVNSFGGKAFTLGGGSTPAWDGIGLPPGTNARAARLKAFDDKSSSLPKSNPLSSSSSHQDISSKILLAQEDDNDDEIAKAIALSMSTESNPNNIASTASTSSSSMTASTASTAAKKASVRQDEEDMKNAEMELLQEENATPAYQTSKSNGFDEDEWDEEMVAVPVNDQFLQQLVDMDFSEVRARKGLVHGHTVEGAITWIAQHQDDADIDQPYMVRKRDTIPKIPLTAEERAVKLEAMRIRIQQRRQEKAVQEKQESIRREKERIERGKQMEQVEEERKKAQRKREIEKDKREKEDAKRERERLRAEIAADKERRRANNGVLPSVLGVDGYNPSAVQYDGAKKDGSTDARKDMQQPSSAASAVKSSSSTTTTTTTSSSSSSSTNAIQPRQVVTSKPEVVHSTSLEERIDAAITTISRYRTGGDGGGALALLITFVRNIVEHPEDSKYCSINSESKAFKSKLSHLVGPVALLKALGFVLNDEDMKYTIVLDDGKLGLLNQTLQKLVGAEELYRRQNA